MMTRICKKCGQEKPLDEFVRNKLCNHGVSHKCKTCERDYSRKYREDNPEKISEMKRKYREDNPEKISERKRKYCEANKDKISDGDRKYREANLERISDVQRKYREVNPEKILRNNVKRNIRKQTGIPSNEISEELIQYKMLQIKLKRKIKNLKS